MSNIQFTPLLPEGWARARGYAHGVSSSGSRIVHIAGQTGMDPDSPAGSFTEQYARALGRVVEVIKTAGGSAENITMMRVYVTSAKAFREAGVELGEAWKKHMGRHFPAITLVEVNELFDPQAQVEIEAEGGLP